MALCCSTSRLSQTRPLPPLLNPLPQTGEQVFGKAQVTPVSFLAWGLVESAGRRNKYTLCFGVGREVGARCHGLRDGTMGCRLLLTVPAASPKPV
jgi:hypothetical protein